MTSKRKKLWFCLAVAGGLATLVVVACGASAPAEVEIPVNVAGEAMTPETIEVKQGDMVTLQIQVDEAGEFHLHGYDIEADLEPGEPQGFFFVADATGRFRITYHPTDQSHTEGAEKEGERKEGSHTESSEKEGADAADHEEQEENDIGFLEVRPR